VTKSVECQNCDQEINRSIPGQAPLYSNYGQIIHTCVPLSLSGISSDKHDGGDVQHNGGDAQWVEQ